jgi:hypothetical protein
MTTYYKTNFLPEFQNYLRQRGLVLEKHIPFFARWAHLYLAFISQDRGEALPFEIGLERFLKHTSIQENCQGWQVSKRKRRFGSLRLFAGMKRGRWSKSRPMWTRLQKNSKSGCA